MDRISVKVEFKKFWWTCPKCGQEDIEDAKVAGGNDYTHICSKCSAKFNQSAGNMKEYNGCLSYPYETYASVKEEDVETQKTTLVEAWVYSVKNPPPYVEPSLQDLQNMLAEKQAEVDRLTEQIQAKEAIIGD
jgi:transcription elongation factor Elf1